MDILNTRDLNKRLNELEDEREDLEEAVTEAKDCDPEEKEAYDNIVTDAIEALKEWDEEYKEELDELCAMRDEISE